MIKAFLFDNGGVMTVGGGLDGQAEARLSKNLGISREQAVTLLSPVIVPYIKGELTTAAFWQAIEQEYGQSISDIQRDIWDKWDEMIPLPEMVKLVERLKSEDYKVGMLSNVIPETEQSIRANGGYELYDFLVLSCEVGFCKPEPGIYDIALTYLKGIKPEEIVFLDDRESSLRPAREMGISTILVENADQAIAAVEASIQ